MNKVIAINVKKLMTLESGLISLAFLFPLVFNNSQIITGSVINAVLFLSASKIQRNKLLVISALPSIGAIANGYLFGKFTIFLLYFLPCIWLGNYLLMRLAKINVIAAISAKCLLLYCTAFLFVSLHVVPKIFLTAMGLLQILTAVIGATFALSVLKYIKKSHE